MNYALEPVKIKGHNEPEQLAKCGNCQHLEVTGVTACAPRHPVVRCALSRALIGANNAACITYFEPVDGWTIVNPTSSR